MVARGAAKLAPLAAKLHGYCTHGLSEGCNSEVENYSRATARFSKLLEVDSSMVYF